MYRSLMSLSLLGAAIVFAVGTTEVEARCRTHRQRCCRTTSYGGTGNWYGNYGGNYGTSQTGCCGNGWSGTTYSAPQANSTYYATSSATSGYASPSNIETRPKTSETATAAGPAPAGETSAPETAPRPGL
jgi:hypothetical protein